MGRGPQHMTHEERLRELNLEKRRLKKNLIVLSKYQADVEEMDLDTFGKCTLKGKQAMVIKWRNLHSALGTPT